MALRWRKPQLIAASFLLFGRLLPQLLLWHYLFRTELVCTGHEVCAEQREADGVSTLGRKFQTLLKHLLKCTAVETRG